MQGCTGLHRGDIQGGCVEAVQRDSALHWRETRQAQSVSWRSGGTRACGSASALSGIPGCGRPRCRRTRSSSLPGRLSGFQVRCMMAALSARKRPVARSRKSRVHLMTPRRYARHAGGEPRHLQWPKQLLSINHAAGPAAACHDAAAAGRRATALSPPWPQRLRHRLRLATREASRATGVPPHPPPPRSAAAAALSALRAGGGGRATHRWRGGTLLGSARSSAGSIPCRRHRSPWPRSQMEGTPACDDSTQEA